MNVGFEDISTSDAARMLKCDITTVSGWCREDLINFSNLSDGTHKGRYALKEKEVLHIRDLMKKHGKRHWREYYSKDWDTPNIPKKKKEDKPVQTYPWVLDVDDVDVDKQEEQYPTVRAEPEKIVEMSIAEPVIEEKKVEFNEDKLLNSILHIREVKEEIENCKARLAQLENEYREYKQEILEWL